MCISWSCPRNDSLSRSVHAGESLKARDKGIMELFFFGDLSVIFPESQVANNTLEGGFNRPLEMLQTPLETIAHGHCEGEMVFWLQGAFVALNAFCQVGSWLGRF